MDEVLGEEKLRTGEGVETGRQQPQAPLRPKPPERVVCPNGITRSQLKDYLFIERSGAELDSSARAVQQHVAAGCEACQRQIIEIEAAEPFLRGEPDPRPSVNVKVIRKLPSENLKRDALVAELSRRLAEELGSPAKSFTLEELSNMNTKIRTVSDIVKRKAIAQRVVEACVGRWERVKSGAGLDPEIEAAAGRLFTYIRAHDANSEPRTVQVEQLGITDETKICEFLLYMMTSTWFLHPEGENTWDLEFASDTTHSAGTDRDSASNSKPKTVLFDIGVLKQALHSQSSIEGQMSPGPLSA